MNKLISKTIITLSIVGLILPSCSLILAQTPSIEAPETLEEVKEMGEEALETVKKDLPGILKQIWEEQVMPIWRKMYDWFQTNIWSKIWPLAKEEAEKRKEIIEEEFEKEKEELSEIDGSLCKRLKKLWKRFINLIK